MKKIISFLTIAIVALSLTTSCNKKLKDDIKDLEKSVDDQKAQNEALQTQVGTLNNLLLLSPLTYSFTTTTDLNEPLTQSGTYTFGYGSNYSSSYITDNGNGTYYVNLWRGADLGTDFSCSIRFTYNPTTNVVSDQYVELYGNTPNGSGYVYFQGTSEITFTGSVTAFDYSAGSITFTLGATTTAAYGSNSYTGKTMNFTSSYSGSMAKYNGAI